MKVRKLFQLNPIAAGALIGALAALVVGGYSQLELYLNVNPIANTGAPQGLDLWTYFSMARAVWRSSNLLTYSYPYELYWPTPPIAFQLPITLLAWIGWFTSLPVAFEIGRVAGAAGTGAAIAALGRLFPRGFWRKWFYVALVLGGGLFGVGAMVASINVAGVDGLTEPHQYITTSMGRLLWWLPFLGMNLRMPLECIYHAMAIGSLACLARGRHLPGLLLGVALWMSNPFSAIAVHAAVVLWLAWTAWERRRQPGNRHAIFFAAWLGVNLVAVVYYGWFLKRWPLYRELDRLYSIQIQQPLEWWRMLMLTLPYGIGLAATLISGALRRAVWGCSRWRLFAILAVVHVVLLQHTALLGERSMQAFHYNRGYLHLALVVTFWRVLIVLLQRFNCLRAGSRLSFWKPWNSQNRTCRIAGSFLAALVLVSCLDQTLFAMYSLSRPSMPDLVAEDYAKAVKRIPTEPAPMLVYTRFSPGLQGSYVTAFTPHIAWDAQESMVVPFDRLRSKLVAEALKGQHGGLAGLGIDYAIILSHDEESLQGLTKQKWKPVATFGSIHLYQSPDPSPSSLNKAFTIDDSK